MNKNTFALRPPMGWNSYDYYDTTVNEEQVKKNADYMAARLKPFGWEYVVVDIQWYASRPGTMRDKFQYIPFSHLEMDEYSRLIPDPERFPSSAGGKGFGPLADYIHSLGLKFGIHIMRGIPRQAAHLHMAVLGTDASADQIADAHSICRWNPDMYGVQNTPEGQAYYNSLLELYASWGVDYIKCDDICNTNNQPYSPAYPGDPFAGKEEIAMLAKAIQHCGRPIVLSLSPGPALIQEAWYYEKYANMWRVTDDFWDRWDLLKDMFRRCQIWQNHVSPGCYPDCDMLPMGRIGKGFGQERDSRFTYEEQKTMMTLWCIFGSPLMLGAELTMLDEQTLSLLTNPHILALLPLPARQIRLTEDEAVWTAVNSETGERYLAFFNLSDEERTLSLSWKEFRDSAAQIPDCAPSRLLDLWSGQEVPLSGQEISCLLPVHGCAAWKL